MRTRIILITLLSIISLAVSQKIGGGDHDIVAHKIVTLTNFLREKSLEDLREFCVKVEQWRSETKKEMFIGVFADIAKKFNKDDAMKYIVTSGLRYSELLDLSFFSALMAPKKLEFLGEAQEIHAQVGGLHDFIWRLPRDTLENFALTAEKFSNDKKGRHLLGGLHDRIRSMSDREIAEYVLDRAQEYPELDSYSTLNQLAAKFGFAKPSQ